MFKPYFTSSLFLPGALIMKARDGSHQCSQCFDFYNASLFCCGIGKTIGLLFQLFHRKIYIHKMSDRKSFLF